MLTEINLPSPMAEKYGQPMPGILRSSLNRSLKSAFLSAGTPLLCECKVSRIIEVEDKVIIVTEDGRREEGSFMTGCDGLNLMARGTILKSYDLSVEPLDFTGIVQVSFLFPFVSENED
jgi:salicylate hydroxylase